MLDTRWGLLYVQLNREDISDPDFIQEGQKLRIPYSQGQLYGQFDSAIDEQSHSSDCRLDTCSCCGLTTGETKVKLALFLLVLLAVYIGYLVMTEQEQPEELQKGKEFIEKVAQ